LPVHRPGFRRRGARDRAGSPDEARFTFRMPLHEIQIGMLQGDAVEKAFGGFDLP
jgi:hypothetical protein